MMDAETRKAIVAIIRSLEAAWDRIREHAKEYADDSQVRAIVHDEMTNIYREAATVLGAPTKSPESAPKPDWRDEKKLMYFSIPSRHGGKTFMQETMGPVAQSLLPPEPAPKPVYEVGQRVEWDGIGVWGGNTTQHEPGICEILRISDSDPSYKLKNNNGEYHWTTAEHLRPVEERNCKTCGCGKPGYCDGCMPGWKKWRPIPVPIEPKWEPKVGVWAWVDASSGPFRYTGICSIERIINQGTLVVKMQYPQNLQYKDSEFPVLRAELRPLRDSDWIKTVAGKKVRAEYRMCKNNQDLWITIGASDFVVKSFQTDLMDVMLQFLSDENVPVKPFEEGRR